MAKSDKMYFENFVACATLSQKAAVYLVECLENYQADMLEGMLIKMHEFEHSADLKKHEMGDALAKAFVTPVDREDLDLLSQQMDNVLDLLEEVMQKLYIYDIHTIEPAAVRYAQYLVQACELLVSIMGEFENFKKSKTLRSLIIACNDIVAISIYKVLHKRNIAVPDQIQLVGFDDISFATLLSPELTTVSQPIREMAEKAVELIVNNEITGMTGGKFVFPVTLVKRQTTKPKEILE